MAVIFKDKDFELERKIQADCIVKLIKDADNKSYRTKDFHSFFGLVRKIDQINSMALSLMCLAIQHEDL